MGDGQADGDRKLKTLEDEIRRIREPLERTLLDIREMINSTENPFNLLAQSLLQDENWALGKKAPSHGDEEVKAPLEPVTSKKQPANFGKSDEKVQFEAESLKSFIDVLAAVDLMVLIVGKEYLLNLINRLAWKGLISKKLLESIKEAVDFLSSMETVSKLDRVAEGQPTFSDILTVLYILSLLGKEDDSSLTFLLLTSSCNFKFLSKSWGVRQ
ncbi:MAG: hypothetical protein QW614_01510 [Candidatus Caldarchaeum sp.]|uniref:Uncharacterized protein n=1 Tax=Caldiarchaeum subterraneum TaxID=311458 RepID=A0A7C5LCA1_CALS0